MLCIDGRRSAGLVAGFIVATALLAGCRGESGLEIAGTYQDQYGSPHVITDAAWDSTYDTFVFVFHILQFSNGEDVLIARNGATNSFNADQYSRFTWTVFAGNLYFCQDPYNAATQDDAANATPPDASDPSVAGCAGFNWSQLIPQ